MPDALVDRRPTVSAARLVSDLVPPPLFAHVSFDTYVPDPGQPSQRDAVTRLRAFADTVGGPRRSTRFGRRTAAVAPGGVYLDGGFGVGKTHLLASLWHAVPQPSSYVTFVELTHLVGVLGFAPTIDALAQLRLLAIDEFELDDPGDTVLVSTLLTRLTERGVAVAVTSNTVPEALGQGRFAAADFRREIQRLADRFETVGIDGPDYRHRGHAEPIPAIDRDRVEALAAARPGATLDRFDALCAHLSSLHPSRYSALVDGVALVGLVDVHPVDDEATALRLVVLVDRLYDRQIPVAATGTALDQVFPPGMLAGGYRKKYQRALSRLAALARLPGEDRTAQDSPPPRGSELLDRGTDAQPTRTIAPDSAGR